jgi:hypothetical protein
LKDHPNSQAGLPCGKTVDSFLEVLISKLGRDPKIPDVSRGISQFLQVNYGTDLQLNNELFISISQSIYNSITIIQ